MPRGGARVGSGRKPKDEAAAWLGGNATDHGDRPTERPEPKPIRLIAAPADLPPAQVALWNELAPFACGERTLVPATVQAFRDLCEAIVLRRRLAAAIEVEGLSVEGKANPLLSQHRGMMQRVEAGMQRFKLTPMGKAIDVPEAQPADPFAEFDGGVQ